MNRHLLFLPAVSLMVASCGGGGSFDPGGYDPLDAAGGGGPGVGVVDTGYKPGEFVKTSMNNAAFFKNKPDGNATADKLLPGNTPMKVISTEGSYVKAELDSGEVGYILSVQVIEQSGGPTGLGVVDDNAVQVWPPPAVGTVPLTEPEVPGAPVIPTEIDPDAPEPAMPDIPALPDDAPTPGLGAEPALPPVPDAGASDADGDAEPEKEDAAE